MPHPGTNARGFEVTVQAPINIALIKYWGKRNEDLMLPLNDSISLTINELYATSTISVGSNTGLDHDVVQLNGKEMPVKEGSRYWRVFSEVRRLIAARQPEAVEWKIRVDSTTNFPTSAGLASSAAGFAAIACGLGRLFQLGEEEISLLARLGSGSACRSLMEGFVHWRAGSTDSNGGYNDHDCSTAVLKPRSHWPELRAIILVFDSAEKGVGSTQGMRRTIQTSRLLQTRIRDEVPRRVVELIAAIDTRNFPQLAAVTMAESNQLHAVCMDSMPPLNYLNADSHALIEFVHAFNAVSDETRLAYTFDAGPNCCLLMETTTLKDFYAAFNRRFEFDQALVKLPEDLSLTLPMDSAPSKKRPLNLKRLVESEVGLGPSCRTSADIDGIEKNCSNTPSRLSQISIESCKML